MDLNKIAQERINVLLELAKKMHSRDKELAERYVSLARKIGMRHRIRIGNKRFCKKCNSIWIPGKTLKVRASRKNKLVLYVCLNCGAVKKFGYARKPLKKGI